jgi:hypothetical protein
VAGLQRLAKRFKCRAVELWQLVEEKQPHYTIDSDSASHSASKPGVSVNTNRDFCLLYERKD